VHVDTSPSIRILLFFLSLVNSLFHLVTVISSGVDKLLTKKSSRAVQKEEGFPCHNSPLISSQYPTARLSIRPYGDSDTSELFEAADLLIPTEYSVQKVAPLDTGLAFIEQGL
jgi:hypothetical protein